MLKLKTALSFKTSPLMLNSCTSFLFVASFVKKSITHKSINRISQYLIFIPIAPTVYADLTTLDVKFETVSKLEWIMTTSLLSSL